MVGVVGCRLFLFEKKRIYMCAQFGLAVCFNARLGFWRDTRKVASPWISVTSFALLSYFY